MPRSVAPGAAAGYKFVTVLANDRSLSSSCSFLSSPVPSGSHHFESFTSEESWKSPLVPPHRRRVSGRSGTGTGPVSPQHTVTGRALVS